jgi:hypothetical protein
LREGVDAYQRGRSNKVSWYAVANEDYLTVMQTLFLILCGDEDEDDAPPSTGGTWNTVSIKVEANAMLPYPFDPHWAFSLK